jgi:hypothetical protein
VVGASLESLVVIGRLSAFPAYMSAFIFMWWAWSCHWLACGGHSAFVVYWILLMCVLVRGAVVWLMICKNLAGTTSNACPGPFQAKGKLSTPSPSLIRAYFGNEYKP